MNTDDTKGAMFMMIFLLSFLPISVTMWGNAFNESHATYYYLLGALLFVSIGSIKIIVQKHATLINLGPAIVPRILLILWSVVTLIFYTPSDYWNDGMVKIIGQIINILLIPAIIATCIQTYYETKVFALGLICAIAAQTIGSMLINPIHPQNFLNPMLDRYQGSNDLANISAFAIMLTAMHPFKRIIKASLIMQFLTIMWACGTRSAWIILMLYIFLASWPTKWKWLTISLLTGVIYVAIMLIAIDPTLLRFDDYSIAGRMLPYETAWHDITSNFGQPHGHVFIKYHYDVLDGSYLVYAVEMGIIGFALLAAMILHCLVWAYRSKSVFISVIDKELYLWACIAATVVVHGIFGTVLFFGFHIHTIIFWLAIVSTHKTQTSWQIFCHQNLSTSPSVQMRFKPGHTSKGGGDSSDHQY